jgi:hypothetical protein
MPKITLTNTETGKDEEFEPIDAREILAAEDTIYKVPADGTEKVGLKLDPTTGADINVPQLQGADDEMQTGNPIDKYDRQAVVKAEAGDPDLTAGKEEAKAADGSDAAKPSEGLTVVELKAALDKKGVAYPATGHKAELAALLDGAK